MDKLGAAQKLTRFLRESGIGDLAEIQQELIKVGSFEAAAEAAKRDLQVTQERRASILAELDKARAGLDAQMKDAETYCTNKKDAGDAAMREASAFVEQKQEAADRIVKAANDNAAQTIADGRAAAEKFKSDMIDSLEAKIGERDAAIAQRDAVNAEIDKRQAVLDQINELLAAHGVVRK